MERFRSEGYFIAAKKEAMSKGVEAKELDSDEVVLEAAYQKALATETDQIQMDDFKDVVDARLMRTHKEDVAKLQRIFDKQKENPQNKETIRLGKILEAIVTEQIELNEWLGPNVNTQQTSEYDDYHNGIDFVAEMNDDGALRHMGFAIDATHGAKQTIRMKLEKIRSQLNHGELGEVFYFQTLDKSFQGRKRFIPRIILALDKKHVAEIARLWVRGEQTALSQHPVKELILREIVDQLGNQLNYAQALEKAGNEKASKLVDVLSGSLAATQRLRSTVVREPVPGEKPFADKGANTIHMASAFVFDPDKVERIDELELQLKIKKRKKIGGNVTALRREYQNLIAKRQGGVVEEVAVEKEEPVSIKEQDIPVEQKEKIVLNFLLNESQLNPEMLAAMSKQELREVNKELTTEINKRQKRGQNANGLLKDKGFLTREFQRRSQQKMQQPDQKLAA